MDLLEGAVARLQEEASSKSAKVRQLEEPTNDKKDEKAIRQIRIRHSDLNRSDPDLFFDVGSSCTIWLGRFGTSYMTEREC